MLMSTTGARALPSLPPLYRYNIIMYDPSRGFVEKSPRHQRKTSLQRRGEAGFRG